MLKVPLLLLYDIRKSLRHAEASLSRKPNTLLQFRFRLFQLDKVDSTIENDSELVSRYA